MCNRLGGAITLGPYLELESSRVPDKEKSRPALGSRWQVLKRRLRGFNGRSMIAELTLDRYLSRSRLTDIDRREDDHVSVDDFLHRFDLQVDGRRT